MISLSVARWTQVAKSVSKLMMKKHALNEMELQYNIAREDLQKEASEFKAYKQCVTKPRRHAPPQEVMGGPSDSKPIKFINNLFEPSMFR